MKVIKPIEKGVKISYLVKGGLVILMILTGFFFNKIYQQRQEILAEKSQEVKRKSFFKSLEENFKENIVSTKKETEKAIDDVLGLTTNFVKNNVASISSSVGDFFYENTVSKIVGEIKKLPEKEQERIKKDICQ